MKTTIARQWSITKPSDNQLHNFYEHQQEQPLTFPVETRLDGSPPVGFQLDDNRVLLGQGEETYRAACDALRCWEMYPKSWIELIPPKAPLQVGTVVLVLARAYGIWWKNVCRIIELFDDNSPSPQVAGSRAVRAYGFTYATLAAHVECGIERFLITQDSEGQVWYQIRAFSRPQHRLLKLAKPLARRVQSRFVRDSKTCLVAAVQQRNAKRLSQGANQAISPSTAVPLPSP
ncbi:DUF1990 family protein [Adhaeretor mobilis]|nr:DUF1990 domain-containing protein [Adhaeretor mobilis]